tara:strand:+ start:957 stop:2009 length:1053 start_codon:yes stop_codon:yes gene_type:complete
MININGAHLEGGGQIIRTALALSTITGKPFTVTDIRKGRKRAGLKAQHLHCIKGLQELCGAKVTDAHIGSESLTFVPGEIMPKTIKIDIGTAGSITLLTQALILPCLFAEKETRLKIIGGTDVQWSPLFDYFNSVLVPQLRKYANIEVILEKRGYYPKGQGKVDIKIKPKFLIDDKDIPKIDLMDQGTIVKINGNINASKQLSENKVAERIAQSAKLNLGAIEALKEVTVEYVDTLSVGVGVTLNARYSSGDSFKDEFNPVILGADLLGEKSKVSEDLGKECALALLDEINSQAAVDKHLADHLIPYLGLFGGSMRVSEITNHTLTNIYVTELFLGKKFSVNEKDKIISV